MKSVEYVAARAGTNMKPIFAPRTDSGKRSQPARSCAQLVRFTSFLVDATGDFTRSASAYSARRAVAGSTRAARLAGRQHAASATPMTRKAAPASASGS